MSQDPIEFGMHCKHRVQGLVRDYIPDATRYARFASSWCNADAHWSYKRRNGNKSLVLARYKGCICADPSGLRKDRRTLISPGFLHEWEIFYTGDLRWCELNILIKPKNRNCLRPGVQKFCCCDVYFGHLTEIGT